MFSRMFAPPLYLFDACIEQGVPEKLLFDLSGLVPWRRDSLCQGQIECLQSISIQ